MPRSNRQDRITPNQGRRDDNGEDKPSDESEIAIVVEQKPHGHRRHPQGRKHDQIPVEAKYALAGRRLAPRAGNTIPITMSPHDVHVPRTRSRARRLFKRSEEGDVENIMLKALDERRPPRAPSRPPGQAEQLRR
jgi:hypothetical protein